MKSLNDARISYRIIYSLLIFQNGKDVIPVLFIIGYLAMAVIFSGNYLIPDYTFWTTLILSFYIISPDKTRKSSNKYLVWAFFMVFLAFISGVKTLYFFSGGFALLFAIEGFYGSIGYLPMLLPVLLSPTFKYLNNMLGFPIRLELSEIAGNILVLLGYKVNVFGNVISMNGTEFSVDQACVGLKMLEVSLLAGLLIMAYYQRQGIRHFNFGRITMVGLLIIGFNIAGNLFRILLLTIFQVPPQNFAHEMVGVMCFLIYIILPSYFVIKWMAARNQVYSPMTIHKNVRFKKIWIINIALFCCLLFTGILKFNHGGIPVESVSKIVIPGYSMKVVNGDILKFEKQGVMIYIKPIQGFYSAEHSPMICWTGCGYKFNRISRQVIGNREVFIGLLKKGNDQLYTAWWFDNGAYKTNGQLDWRWRAFKGEKFYLVNISAENEKVLRREIRDVGFKL